MVWVFWITYGPGPKISTLGYLMYTHVKFARRNFHFANVYSIYYVQKMPKSNF